MVPLQLRPCTGAPWAVLRFHSGCDVMPRRIRWAKGGATSEELQQSIGFFKLKVKAQLTLVLRRWCLWEQGHFLRGAKVAIFFEGWLFNALYSRAKEPQNPAVFNIQVSNNCHMSEENQQHNSHGIHQQAWIEYEYDWITTTGRTTKICHWT